MWYILHTGNEGEKYSLLTGQQYVVGRKDADILVLNDPSISRKHAVFIVSHLECNINSPHKPPVLSLEEVSKLGTDVQGQRIKGATKQITNGDVIVFGTLGSSKYQAVYEPFILATSCIAGPAKKSVKSMVAKLSGHIISEWRKDCQLLVMSNLSVTVKVICALVSLKCIVTPQYLEDLIKAHENKTDLPKEKDYLPPLAESQIDASRVSFKPNEARQKLLQGKIFIFLSPKQFKKLSIVIELAGGTPMLMEEGTDNNEDDILISPGTCVMACDPVEVQQMSQNAQNWINHVLSFLKRNGKSPIFDPEIGFAILYCSTEDHCNPDKNSSQTSGMSSRPPLVPQSFSQAPASAVGESEPPEILAPDTEFNTTLDRTRHAYKGDVTHINETRAEIKIKEEPVSQVSSMRNQSQTPSRKRQREISPNADTLTEVPSHSKKRNIANKVKPEPITPMKDPVVGDPVASPAKSTRSRRSTRSRSPSPVPRPSTSTRKNKAKQEVKQETAEFDHFDEFDSIPARKSRNRNKPTEREAARKEENVQNAAEKDDIVRSGVIDKGNEGDTGTLFDDFDAIPSRKSRNRLATNSQAAREKETIPSTSKINVKPSEVCDSLETEDVKVESDDYADDFDVIPARKSRSAKDASKKNDVASGERINVKGENRPGNALRVKEETAELSDSEARLERKPLRSTARSVGEGFLSTEMAAENQNAKISEFSAKEENLPVSCAIVQEKSLMARKPGERQERATRLDGNYSMWKGKKVKNYKRFKKAGHSGFNGLPHIIGGSDLVAHECKHKEELEEWFREEMQAESQQNEIERLAKEMFEWEPSTKKKRQR